MSWSINWFKQHLARIPGEVADFMKAPQEVYLKIKENMKWHHIGRRRWKSETMEIAAFYMHSDNKDGEEQHREDLLWCISKDKLTVGDKSSDNDIRNKIKGRSPGSSSSGAETQLIRSRLDSFVLNMLKGQTSPDYKQVNSNIGFDKVSHKEVISAISANSFIMQESLEMQQIPCTSIRC